MVEEVAALSVRLEATAARFEADMRRATRSMDGAARKMETRAGRLDNRLNRVGRDFGLNIDARAAIAAAAIYGVGRAVASIVRNGDNLKRLEGRFTALTGSADRAAGKIRTMFEIGSSTGLPIDAIADALTRFTIASEAIGATDADVARVTENILKLGQIGGGSTQELASGAMQLGQALASGVLQGEELRSILENMPLVARQIAEGFGVSVGQLREMGKEGQLTADKVFGALLKGTEEVDAKFRELPITVDRAATQLANSWALFTGELDKSLGISNALASVLQTMALGLDRITSGLTSTALDAKVTELRRVQNQLAEAAAGGGGAQFSGEMSGFSIGAPNTAALEARQNELLADIRAIQDKVTPPIVLEPITVSDGGASPARSGGGGKATTDDAAANMLVSLRERLDLLREEQQLIGLSDDAAARLSASFERQRVERDLLAAAARKGATITQDEIAQAQAAAAGIEAVTIAIHEQTEAIRRQEEAARLAAEAQAEFNAQVDEISASAVDALVGLADGTLKWNDALKQVLVTMLEIARQEALGGGAGGSFFSSLIRAGVGAIGGGGGFGSTLGIGTGGLYAKGAAFNAGRVVPFASGGVVTGPTNFPMSGGRTGVMGEAGPEAIMPLKRGAGGKLGIEGAGGGSVKIVNVLDPRIVGEYLSTSAGERLIVNTVQRNRAAL